MATATLNGLGVFSTSLVLAVALTACAGGGGGDGRGGSTWVVFGADKDTDETFELYAATDDGRKLVELSGSLVAGGDVSQFYISPNRRWVAYVAPQSVAAPPELYVVPIDGSAAPRKISGDLGPHGTIGGANGFGNIEWSPDSTRLTFLADIEVDGIDELYLTDVATGAPVKINGSVGTTVEIGQAFWSPDGRYVAYFVRNRNISGFILDQIAINVHDAAQGTPNSTRVTGTVLSGGTIQSGGILVGDYISGMKWSPDSARIAYVIDQGGVSRELRVGLPVGTNSLVNGTLGTNQSLGLHFRWSPDARYLAYEVRQPGLGVIGLNTHDTTVGGRDSRRITPPVAGVIFSDFAWAPDSSRVAYSAQQDNLQRIELYTSTPAGSGNNAKVSGAISDFRSVTSFAWAPNSTTIAYIVDQETFGIHELYSASPDGSATPIKVSAPNAASVLAINWFSTSDRLLYDDDTPSIFTTSPSGSGAAVKVSGNVAVTGTSLVSPNGDRVAFRGTQGASGIGLFAATPDGNSVVRLPGVLVTGGNVTAAKYEEVRSN